MFLTRRGAYARSLCKRILKANAEFSNLNSLDRLDYLDCLDGLYQSLECLEVGHGLIGSQCCLLACGYVQ